MDIPAVGSVSVLEAFWLLAAVIGLTYSGNNLHRAFGDYDFVVAYKLNGGRRIVARGNIRRELLRIVSLLACLFLGIYAAVPTDLQAYFRGWLAPLLLVIIIITQVANSVTDNHERRALLSLLKVVDRHKESLDG